MRDSLVYSSVQIAVAVAMPTHHCDHNDGTISVRLHPEVTASSVYLMGTPDELLDFAARLVAAVPVAECNPLAGMHVDPHTCGLRARDDDRPLSLGECLTESAVAELARERDDDNDERRLGSWGCDHCGQTMIHDCARYWFCANESCPQLRHTILITDAGTKSRVGTIQ